MGRLGLVENQKLGTVLSALGHMWLWIPSVSMTVEAWERWMSIIGGAAQELRFLAFIGTFTHYIMTYQRKLILCYIVVRITCGRRRYSHTVHYHQKQMMCNLMFC